MTTVELRAVSVCWDFKEVSNFHYSVLMYYIRNGYMTPKQIDCVLRTEEANRRKYFGHSIEDRIMANTMRSPFNHYCPDPTEMYEGCEGHPGDPMEYGSWTD